ncbi:MAG: radical SAM protein [Phycisphaerales bacterium]|nr:radical SAM protein [Phycisphaerales bacterium]
MTRPPRLRVSEIFHSVQGEGTRAGVRCVFVRLTGCHLRCAWCDTEYAFYEGTWMTLDEILAEVERYRCPTVELTGGEPLLQPATPELLARLCERHETVLLETSGAVPIDAVDPRVVRIVDIKCPGSGEAERNHWPNFDVLSPRDEVKCVLADRADYEWARGVVVARGLIGRCPVVFMPVHGRLAPAELAEWILADGLDVRLGVQLHKTIWPAVLRGV